MLLHRRIRLPCWGRDVPNAVSSLSGVLRVAVAVAAAMASACAPEPGIGLGVGSPNVSAAELLRRVKDTSEFHRLTSQAEVERAFSIRIGPGATRAGGRSRGAGFGPAGDAAERPHGRPRVPIPARPQPESIARGVTLFEASVTLWLANAPCLDFAGVAHGFMWSGPWAVSLKKDTFHGDYAPGSGPPQDSVGGGYAIEFKATQPSGRFALFRFPPCTSRARSRLHLRSTDADDAALGGAVAPRWEVGDAKDPVPAERGGDHGPRR